MDHNSFPMKLIMDRRNANSQEKQYNLYNPVLEMYQRSNSIDRTKLLNQDIADSIQQYSKRKKNSKINLKRFY